MININGKDYVARGTNVVVKNGKVIVGGETIEEGLKGDVRIEWVGDLANLNCRSCKIEGDVKGDVDATTISCGNVGGDVDGTTIKCGNVDGDVDGTTVNCGNVKGDVDAMTVKRK